jgi:hypothetical protein
MSRGRSSAGSLRAAFAEYLPELNLCECDTCHAVAWTVGYVKRALAGGEERYWAAVSAQLREVVEGRHVRREHAAWVASLPPSRGPLRHESISGGLGVGVGIGGDHYQARLDAVIAARDAAHIQPEPAPVLPLPTPPAVEEPGQAALFDLDDLAREAS